MIKAVVFDLDDTIYDYGRCHNAGMKALTNHVVSNYKFDEKTFLEAFEKAKRRVKLQLGNTAASHNRMLYMQSALEILEQNPITNALEMYNAYWDAFLGELKLYPYVQPLLDTLASRKIKVGVLTDLTAHIQHRKLQQMGIAEYITAIVTSEEAGVEKPATTIFRCIVEKLGVDPAEIVMVGDSKSKDFDGAVKAGMHSLLFEKGMESSMYNTCMEYIDEN